jgi:WD40 repeat protein
MPRRILILIAFLASMLPGGFSVTAQASENGTVIEVDNASQVSQLQVLKGHAAAVYTLAFNPTGSVLASGGEDKTVMLWDTTTGEKVAALDKEEKRIVYIGFSSDGAVLVTRAGTETQDVIRVYDAKTLKVTKSFTKEDWTGLAISPDGQSLALTGCLNPAGMTSNDILCHTDLRVMNIATGNKEAIASAGVNVWDFGGLSFSADGTLLVLGTTDGIVRLVDIKEKKDTILMVKVKRTHIKKVVNTWRSS